MKPHRHNEAGIALLSVLAITAAMAVAALIALDAVAKSVALSKIAAGRSQTSWYVRSVEEIAVAMLDKLAAQAQDPETGLVIQGDQSITLSVPGGRIDAILSDASNCFNLNGIASKNERRGYDIDQDKAADLRQLLMNIDLPSGDAAALTDALSDWIDVDSIPAALGYEDGYYLSQKVPYRTAGTLLSTKADLRAIAGFTAEITEAVSPYVCVRPDISVSRLNINMLSPEGAPLLAAVYSRALEVEAARSLLAHRPQSGWESVEEFLAEEEITQIHPDQRRDEALSIGSNYFSVSGRVSVAQRSVPFEVLLSISGAGDARVLSTRIGEF